MSLEDPTSESSMTADSTSETIFYTIEKRNEANVSRIHSTLDIESLFATAYYCDLCHVISWAPGVLRLVGRQAVVTLSSQTCIIVPQASHGSIIIETPTTKHRRKSLK
eukprot:scaffold171773_cov43-Attheya_sp.AAC.1